MMGKPNAKVARWYDEVLFEIEKRWPEGHAPIDISTLLALIDVESDGDPFARKPQKTSQFWGMLQQGWKVSVDLGHSKRFPAWKTASYLHGEPVKAIREFLEQIARTESNHEWRPDLIAIQWKGGGGTTRQWKRMERAGLKPADQYPFNGMKKATDLRVPWQHRVPIYVNRFKKGKALWDDYTPPAAIVGAAAGGQG